ncbi:MAG: methyltransferase domain-containing protein [Sulfurovum sp.]|nr:methyltransferase domain-containing protein [Sulfurovum sp.]
MQRTSKIMDVFLKLKLDAIAWSLRRLHCPVDKNALVLEVGSGGNPYFRSNVLIDAYLDTRERHYTKLISDRPTVLGFVENLPFKDNSFDFVIASHVLEHSKDPEKFISEIQRVAKAGYIEVPDAFFERLACYLDHRLEITDIENEIQIRKKKYYIQDEEIEKLLANKVKPVFGEIVSKYPFKFNVRYYWSKENGGIKYNILNPEYEFDWESPISDKVYRKATTMAKIKTNILHLVRKYFSQNNRNKNLNIKELMMCPKCKSSDFDESSTISIECKKCNSIYEILEDKIVKFN